jgi:hypothetical protein
MNKSGRPPRARGAFPIYAYTAPLSVAIYARTAPCVSREATR